jgi:hypothetical protein
MWSGRQWGGSVHEEAGTDPCSGRGIPPTSQHFTVFLQFSYGSVTTFPAAGDILTTVSSHQCAIAACGGKSRLLLVPFV